MIIIIFMYYLIFKFFKSSLKNLNKLNLKKVLRLFLYGLIFQLILFIIYRINLYCIGREVYFSDAETYWNNTLEIMKYGKSLGYNSLYYIMDFFVQLLSPFIWVGWNNLFNIACIDLSLVIVINRILNKNTDNKLDKIKYLIILVLFNPFITYGLMRNLKDALFLLMTFLTTLFGDLYFNNKKKWIKISIVIVLLFLTYLFILIRPWGFMIPLVVLLYIFIRNLLDNKKNIFKDIITNKKLLIGIIGLIIVSLIFIFPSIYSTLKVWIPTVLKSLFSRNIINTILGFGRFFFAPGPYRSLFGNIYFEYYLISGNIMSFIGQLMWWTSIIFIIVSICVQKFEFKSHKDNHFLILLILLTIMYIGIYVIQYAGTGEIRLKSVLYIYIYSVYFMIYDLIKYKTNKKIYTIVSVVMLFLYMLIIIVGV